MVDESDRLQQLEEENKQLQETVKQLQKNLNLLKQSDGAREDRNHLLFLLDNAPLGLIEYDQSQRIRAFSKGAENLFGWKAEEVLGKYWYEWQHIHEEDEPAVVGNVNRYITEKLAHSTSVNRNRRKDGSLIWCEWNDTAVFDDSGNVSRTLSFVRNVTARVEGEQKLSESEKQFRALFETMLLGVLIHNSNGFIIAGNPASERILGLSRDELIGRHSTDLRWDSVQEDGTAFPDEKQPVMQVLQTGQDICDVVMGVFNTRENDYRWIRITAMPLFRSGEEKPYQVYTTFEDITVERKSIQALRDSEERYRSLFISLFSGFALHEIICDEDGKPVDYRFLEANPAFERLTGLNPDEMVGRTILEVLPGIEPEWIERYGQVALSGEPLSFESYSRELERHYQVLAYSPRQGQFATIFTDVTEAHRTRQALLESEERYRALVEAAPFSIMVMQDEKYVFANQAAAYLHGKTSAQDLIGKSSFYNVPVAYHAIVEERLRRLREGQPNQGMELKITGLDGVERVVMTISVLIQFRGKPAVLVIGQDITERKKLEASILSVEKMASIGTLAAGIAHEINSPLQIITGLSRRLINQLESNNFEHDHVIKDLTSMEQNSWRVARIVRSLLSYSRVSLDEMRKNNLNEIVQDTLVLIEHQLASWSNIRIKTELQQDIPDMFCERNSLIQVLINLLSNARDAMPGGGTILLRTRNISIRKRFILQVEDKGAGIAQNDLKRIFEPFFTTKGPSEGTGLGLSVVKNIIESHGGTIHVTSNPGKGSLFTILLPEVPPILNQQIPED